MKKIIGKIFNPEKLGDSIISGVDKAILSKEEKLDYMAKFLKLYEPYKLAQRYIALIVTLPFMFLFVMGGLLWVYLYFTGGQKDDVYDLWKYMNVALGFEFKLIVGFYFAGGVIEGTVNKFKKKKSGNTTADTK